MHANVFYMDEKAISKDVKEYFLSASADICTFFSFSFQKLLVLPSTTSFFNLN